MADDFFENHELSLWIFSYGISNIILLLLGGGVACFLMVMSIHVLTGELSAEQFGISLTIVEVLMALAIMVPNVLIIRGKPSALAVNKIMVCVQIASYLLFAMTFDQENKWFGLAFGVLPFLSLWLMSTPRYRAFIAYHEALHKDPIGFREKLLQRISDS